MRRLGTAMATPLAVVALTTACSGDGGEDDGGSGGGGIAFDPLQDPSPAVRMLEAGAEPFRF